MVKKVFLAGVFGVLVLGFAFAEEFLGDLGTYLITSQKQLWQTSKGVEVITEEEIENSGAKNLVEALKENSTLLSFDWLGNSSQASIDSLGFGEASASNVLVLIDGRRVNEIDLSGVDWLQIPVSNIEKIEIIKGGYSTFYGDNAVGAVINIITKTPEKKEIILGLNTGSFSTKGFDFSAENKIRDFSYRINSSFYDSDGYRENNFIKRKDIGISFGYKNLKLNSGYTQNKYGLPGGLWEDQYLKDRTSSNNLKDNGSSDIFYMSLSYKRGITNTLISWRDKKLSTEYFSSWGNTLYDTKYPQLHLREVLSLIFLNEKNILNLGLESFFANSKSDVKDIDTGVLKNNSSVNKKSFGLFFENRFFLKKNFVLNFSGRSENVIFDLKSSGFNNSYSDEKKEKNIGAYSLGISYSLKNSNNIYLNYNLNFRLPNVDEFKIFDNNYIPKGINSNLSYQKSKEIDFGIRKGLSKNLKISLNFYLSKVKNEIFYNPLTGANENYPLTLHRGFDFVFDFRIKNINFGLNYSFVDARLKEDYGAYKKGNFIPGVPKNKISANLNFEPLKNFNLNLNSVFTGKRFFISDWKNEGKKLPSFSILNLNLKYKLKNVNFYLKINNIFDRKFSEYGTYYGGYYYYYYPSPDRTISGGLDIDF